MPINIMRKVDDEFETVAGLCDDDWELPRQIGVLEEWLQVEGKALPPSAYIADVGFDIRPDACGGGAVVTAEMIRLMANLGMELHLSEYPGLIEREASE